MPSNQDLAKILYNSPLSWYLNDKQDDSSKHVLDMSMLKNIELFYGQYDVYKAEIDKTSQHIVLYGKHGDIFEANPDGSESQMYQLAKFNFICTAAAFVPSVGHSWVHFNFPEIISAAHYNMKHKDSVLYKLLFPHTRFTLGISDAVLRTIQYPIINHDTTIAKYLYTLAPFPAEVDNFLYANSRHTLDYYREDQEPDKGFQCPPALNDNIPYQKVLHQYYDKISTFLYKIESDLAPELPKFMAEIHKSMHLIPDQYKPIDVLATFIWQAAIVHNTDHFSLYRIFMNDPNYNHYDTVLTGGMATATVITKEMRECNEHTSLAEIADSLYFDRWRNFLITFVRYNHNADPEFDYTMAKDKLSYGFCQDDPSSALCAAEKEFKQSLDDLEQQLIGDGSLLCPLAEMSPSISY